MKKHWTNIVSQLFGRFACHDFPSKMQSVINHAYVNIMGVDMSEFAPPSTYPTLNKLFTREFKKHRQIDQRNGVVISPVDGYITECGKLHEDIALQIKGMSYSIDDLLTLQYAKEAKELYNGDYINFYLSPKDYHRYHMPYKLRVTSILHQPGALYPVNIPSLKRKKELFVENERVVLECFTEQNRRIFIVLIGALNVGKMTISFDPRIQTNADKYEPSFYRYDDKSKWLYKGDLLGMFMMGSTVVILSEPDTMRIETAVGKNVRFGERVAAVI